MEKTDGPKEREAIRATSKSECIGKAAPVPAGGTTTDKTVSAEKSCGQRTIRKVEKTMKKTIFEQIEGIIKQMKKRKGLQSS